MNTNFEFENEAGKLVQIVRNGWSQVNIIFSKKSSLRGGHYHKYNKECFYIYSGKFKLKVWNKDMKEEHMFKAGDMFVIPPYVFHTFDYLEDTVLVSMYDNGVELGNDKKDIWIAYE